MPVSVEIHSRVMGSEADLSAVLLEIFEEQITLAELIRRTVEEQVHTLLAARRADAAQGQRLLDRQYMTDAEIAAQAHRGAVRFPGATSRGVPTIHVAREVARAQAAFREGKFVIFTGDRRLTDLDEPLSFTEQTTITFLRVMPLVGG